MRNLTHLVLRSYILYIAVMYYITDPLQYSHNKIRESISQFVRSITTVIKCIIEPIIALTLLIITLEITLPILLIIAINIGGNPLFLQERVGKNGKKFFIVKIKTMRNGVPILNHSRHMTLEINKERITPMGKLLRETHIDEFLNLINIVKGELSFFGPRAIVPEHVKYIYNIKPGLFGIQQLLSLYNESNIDHMYDIDKSYYSENRCLSLDLYIIYKTISYIISSVVYKILTKIKLKKPRQEKRGFLNASLLLLCCSC